MFQVIKLIVILNKDNPNIYKLHVLNDDFRNPNQPKKDICIDWLSLSKIKISFRSIIYALQNMQTNQG